MINHLSVFKPYLRVLATVTCVLVYIYILHFQLHSETVTLVTYLSPQILDQNRPLAAQKRGEIMWRIQTVGPSTENVTVRF